MRRLFLAAALAPALPCQNVPDGFTVETLIGSGLSQPNDLCFLPDGRTVIAESGGGVRLYAGGAPVTLGTVPSVESGGERGLLSVAADPDFATNGYLYVYYSSSADAFMHLDRFTCVGDRSLPTSTNLSFAASSRRVLLGALPDNAGNHNGGSARFGPDGRLYLTVGDDAFGCNAQSTTSQAGCLLRLSVDAVPAGGSTTLPAFSLLDPGDNPLSGNTDFSQLVIAIGLRNPFRMEIDPVTGSLYIGDVGQDTQEEYTEYVYPSGPLPLVNFGWPWREGTIAGAGCGGSQPAGMLEPIATVTHSQGWQAIMGGARYRNLGGGSDFGAAYESSAFFVDYAAGELRRVVQNGNWGPAPAVPGQPNASTWGNGFGGVTALRLGPDGALWFTQRSGTGLLKRVRVTAPAAITPFGAGCAMSSGASVQVAWNQPWADEVLTTAITGLPPTAWAIVVTSFDPWSPPLALASVLPEALPGCQLFVEPDIQQPTFVSTGAVTSQLFLPNTPPLTGLSFYQQVVVIETNAGGGFVEITSSDAVRLLVGER